MREINTEKKKRWVSLYVENRIGVLARISGMMSGKSYNISSITVGVTEDPTVSRMTIGLSSDDATFEQIKKQLNRCVEVIKLNDITDAPTHMKEILFVKIHECSEFEKGEIFRISQVFGAKAIDYGINSVLLAPAWCTAPGMPFPDPQYPWRNRTDPSLFPQRYGAHGRWRSHPPCHLLRPLTGLPYRCGCARAGSF